jgi:hypothetical protein
MNEINVGNEVNVLDKMTVENLVVKTNDFIEIIDGIK